MDSLNVSRKSWHYRLAHTYYWNFSTEMLDICSYTRRVFFGLLMALSITVALSALLLMFAVCPALYIIACAITGNWFEIPAEIGVPYIILIIPAIMIGGAIGITKFVRYVKEYQSEDPPEGPGFLRLAYRSFKDKFCIKINIVGDHDA
jgi:hypothetical protein